jgi:hypothetical protein
MGSIDSSLRAYRRRPGLDPSQALTWYTAHVTITAKSDSYRAIARFLADVMDVDASHWISNARVPGPGHRPATEAASHQEQLMRDMNINQFNSRDGQAVFDFDVQQRFVPFVTRWIRRELRRQVFIPSGVDLDYIISLYVFNYPQQLWQELTGAPPKDEPVAPPIEAADWGKQSS